MATSGPADFKQFTDGRVDFVPTGSNVDFSHDEQVAVYQVRKAVDTMTIADTDVVGKVVFEVPIDTTIDPVTEALASKYEYYGIEDMKFTIEAVSPLGDSSGGVEMCQVTDPQNADLVNDVDTYAYNFDKAVRQNLSFLNRPRDSGTLEAFTVDQLYTTRKGDPRFYSYGTVYGVVRSPPATGNQAIFVVSVSAKYTFSRTSESTGSSIVTSSVPTRIGIEFDDDQFSVVFVDKRDLYARVKFDRPFWERSAQPVRYLDVVAGRVSLRNLSPQARKKLRPLSNTGLTYLTTATFLHDADFIMM